MRIKSTKSNAIIFLTLLSAAVCCLVPVVSASDPGSGDWPMWGGTPDRNMVSNMKGLPTSWDVKTKKNVKWVAQLGSQSYGNPVVSGGMVFVGTNNEGLRRRGFSADDIAIVRRAYRTLYRANLSLDAAREALAQEATTQPLVAPLVTFLSESSRGIVR